MTATIPPPSAELAALHAAVCLHPAEDLHRLAYADRLDDEAAERGEPLPCPRAEFIRVQCEIERIRGGGCAAVLGSACDGKKEWCVRCGLITKALAIHNSIKPLPEPKITPGRRAWVVGDEPLETYGRGTRFKWRRGFLEGVALSALNWLAHADALVVGRDVCPECDGKGVVVCEFCGGSGTVEHPNGGVNNCPESYDTTGNRPYHLGKCSTPECNTCCGTGTVPRPCPPLTAHPITSVTLLLQAREVYDLRLSAVDAADPAKGYTSPRWPGTTFYTSAAARDRPPPGG